jgi:Ca2+-binding EF-hand superfamily protein
MGEEANAAMKIVFALTFFMLACHSAPASRVGSAERANEGELRRNLDKMFAAIDSDHNDCISKAEWRSSIDREVSTSDKNAFVDPSDFRRRALHVFSELDLNNDGCISVGEYLESSRRSSQRLEPPVSPRRKSN